MIFSHCVELGHAAPVGGGESLESEEEDKEIWEVLNEIDAVSQNRSLTVIIPYVEIIICGTLVLSCGRTE
jgi:hypothetical protein